VRFRGHPVTARDSTAVGSSALEREQRPLDAGAVAIADGRRLRCDGLLLCTPTTARCFGAGDPAAFALRDEVTALLDLAQDAVALDRLPEASDQVLG